MDEVVHDLKAAIAGLTDFLVSSLRRDAGWTSRGEASKSGINLHLAEALVERLGSALVTAKITDYREKSNGSHVTSNTKNIDAEAQGAARHKPFITMPCSDRCIARGLTSLEPPTAHNRGTTESHTLEFLSLRLLLYLWRGKPRQWGAKRRRAR